MMSLTVAPQSLAGGAPRQADAGAEDKGPALPVAKFIIVADTDAHGTSLGAAIVKALLDQGVPAEDIAIHSHFNPKGLSTSARGDLIGYINELKRSIEASGVKPIVFIADIPTPIQAPEDYANALAELARVADRILYIDTAGHGFNAKLPAHLAKRGITNVQFKLGLSVPQTYLPAALMAPSVQVYDLATIGTVLDMDIQAIPELNIIREMAEQAEEAELPPLTIEKVRENMHSFVAFDQYLKFGRDWQAPAEFTKLFGNMATKIAVMAITPIAKLYEKAQEFANLPSVEEVRKLTDVEGFVAIVKPEAPKGGVFNYSKLAQAGLSTPIVITYSVGFQPGKKVIVAAPNAFEKETEPIATEAIKKAVNDVFEELVERGWSNKETDFPRGVGALTLGVNEDHLHEAIQMLVARLNKHFIELDRAKYAAMITKAEMLALVADERLASALANIVEKVVRSAVEACKRG